VRKLKIEMTIGGVGLCLKRCVIWTTICV